MVRGIEDPIDRFTETYSQNQTCTIQAFFFQRFRLVVKLSSRVLDSSVVQSRGAMRKVGNSFANAARTKFHNLVIPRISTFHLLLWSTT